MPFPLAHPAAVLPLRHVKALCFPALVIGSLTPDLGYMFPGGVSRLSHHFLGSFLFCLPVGLLTFVLFELIRRPLVDMLPSPHRQALQPLCEARRHSWWSIALSILIGAWTHMILDTITRESQVVVAYLGPIQDEIAALQRNGLRFSRLLWLVLSVLGMGWLTLAYLQLLRRRTGRWRFYDPAEKGRYAIWLGIVIVPLLLAMGLTLGLVGTGSIRRLLAYFLYKSLAYYLVAFCCLVVLIGLGLRLRQTGQRGAN